mgnify:CR=1 FL=1
MDHDYASLQDFTQLMRDMKLSGLPADPKYDQLEEEDAYQWNFIYLKIALILRNLIKTFVKKEEVLFRIRKYTILLNDDDAI